MSIEGKVKYKCVCVCVFFLRPCLCCFFFESTVLVCDRVQTFDIYDEC